MWFMDDRSKKNLQESIYWYDPYLAKDNGETSDASLINMD